MLVETRLVYKVFVVIPHVDCNSIDSMVEFPRRPTGLIKQGITAEADARLSFYIPIPVDPNIPPEFAPPPKPKLPPGVVDAPLVRLYNYLCEFFA